MFACNLCCMVSLMMVGSVALNILKEMAEGVNDSGNMDKDFLRAESEP